jgi:glycine dehydrogenase subunit 1
MRYIPHTEADVQAMLGAIGARAVDDLFAVIPEKLRLGRALDLPPALAEPDLLRHLEALAAKNAPARGVASFLGGGFYSHYVPAVLDQLLLRSEFYTAYTPYQPEVAQGTLQAIFEFQTLVCQLFGMEAANASLYDGGSALAEAVLMAGRVTRRTRFLVARSVNPAYRRIVATYTKHLGWEAVEVPFGADGRIDGAALAGALAGALGARTACVAVQSPNYFGVVEDLAAVGQAVAGSGALFVTTVTEPLAYAILKPPGGFGADIACGEGQSFGLPVSFGGPHVGLFATREKYVRQMPGRLCGETTDARGARGYVLTLSTREQHIRREKATSNICTNQALCALANTIYLTLLGRRGLRKLAQANLDLAEYARTALTGVPGVRAAFAGPTFNEFVIVTDRPAAAFLAALPDDLLGGIDVSADYPELPGAVLVTVTENNPKEEIDRYARLLAR